ncbi:hypothetical protein V6N11_059369 [Hibiscus sabdariffa]|uniref:Uncharacterized protein n=1 Tax=Hibiscus sabdariffa TaxID=183260 RepID=A0ABR2AE77_9ROSI
MEQLPVAEKLELISECFYTSKDFLLQLEILVVGMKTIMSEENFSEDSVQDWYLGITDGEKMVLDKLVRYLQLSMDLLRAIHHIKWHKDALQTLFSKLGELGSQVVEEEENLGIKFEFLTLEDRATLESTLQSYDTEEAILRKMGELNYCPFLKRDVTSVMNFISP